MLVERIQGDLRIYFVMFVLLERENGVWNREIETGTDALHCFIRK